jgi:hypothetical protein
VANAVPAPSRKATSAPASPSSAARASRPLADHLLGQLGRDVGAERCLAVQVCDLRVEHLPRGPAGTRDVEVHHAGRHARVQPGVDGHAGILARAGDSDRPPRRTPPRPAGPGSQH